MEILYLERVWLIKWAVEKIKFNLLLLSKLPRGYSSDSCACSLAQLVTKVKPKQFSVHPLSLSVVLAV